MDFRPRDEWIGEPFGFSRALVPDRVQWLALHYPADSSLPKPPTIQNVAASLRGYRNYHIRTQKWPDIGYCYAIDQAGRVWECAGERVAAHSASPGYPLANHDGIGVLLVLGNTEQPTGAMINAIRELRVHLRTRYHNMNAIMGHRDVPGAATACPGEPVTALLRSGVLDSLPEPVTPPTGRPGPDTGTPPIPGYRFGDRGTGVAEIQRRLAARGGWDIGPDDGDFGPRTHNVVEGFQRLFGLVVDGIVGVITWAALWEKPIK